MYDTMTDFTPGPWEQNGTSIVKFGEGGRAIAILADSRSDNTGNVEPSRLDDPAWDVNMANASLIADAPRLLAENNELRLLLKRWLMADVAGLLGVQREGGDAESMKALVSASYDVLVEVK